MQSILNNVEIKNVMQILGLRPNMKDVETKYVMQTVTIKEDVQVIPFATELLTPRSLRYGHVMIMADQDHDGTHIKGAF